MAYQSSTQRPALVPMVRSPSPGSPDVFGEAEYMRACPTCWTRSGLLDDGAIVEATDPAHGQYVGGFTPTGSQTRVGRRCLTPTIP